jgi:hypothetical protein
MTDEEPARERTPTDPPGVNAPGGLVYRIRPRVMTLRWTAVAMVVFALFMAVALPLARPQDFAQAIGATSTVDAVVDSATLSQDQPRKQRRSGPSWDVHVRWTEAGTDRTGMDRVRSHEVPHQPGDVVSIEVTGSGAVSMRSDGYVRGGLIAVSAFALGFLVAAPLVWRSSRKWTRLPDVVREREPVPVTIAEVEPMQRKIGERTLPLHYRPEDPGAHGGWFAVHARKDGRNPRPDDRLLVWSSRPERRGPFAVLRPDDGTWWVGQGADPVPSMIRPQRRFRR